VDPTKPNPRAPTNLVHNWNSNLRFDPFWGGFEGLELVRKIRKHYQLPYIYMLMRSAMNQLDEIKGGLDAGVDDYLVKPHNPFQIRSRVLVGLRWLTHIDSITWKRTEETSARRR